MESFLPFDVMLSRLLLAVGLAFLMALDREIKGKPYGLRPYMMVSLASCGFILIILKLAHEADTIAKHITMDPGQVVQAVIGATGFLGAAAVLRAEKNIVGATTGTGLLVAGAVGVSCGLGYYALAVLMAIFTLMILVMVGRLHDHIQKRSSATED